MHLIMIVKGNPEQAILAAKKRGFIGVELSTCDLSHPESVVLKAIGPEAAACNWMCEDLHINAPFPVGSLLYYKEALP